MIERLSVGAQRLLLSHLRTRPQPSITATCSSEHFRQAGEGRFTPGALLVHRFVPQEPAAMPLGQKYPFREHAGAQTIGVTDDFPHERPRYSMDVSDRVWMSSASNNTIVYRCNHTACGTRNTGGPSSADTQTNALEQIIGEVCDEHRAHIIELETMHGHVHLLVSVDPHHGVRRLVKQVKGRSSRLLRQVIPLARLRTPDAVDQQRLRRHSSATRHWR